MRMKRIGSRRGTIGSFVVVLVAVLALSGPAVGAVVAWKVVKSKSATGEFAVTAISATVKNPKTRGIAVRLRGRVSNGSATVACSKDFSIASWNRDYRRAGLYVVPQMRGAESCQIVASVAGSGTVTVQILKRR
jgi:hypothetical protein